MVRAEPGQHRILVAANPDPATIILGLLLRADLPRETPCDDLRGLPFGRPDRARRHVMTGDQPPQHAIANDRHGG